MFRSAIIHLSFAVLLVPFIGAALSGCDKADSVTSNIPDATLPQEYQLTGEQLLTQSLDDIQALSDWAASASQAQLNSPLPLDKSANVAADSTFVYGQLSPEGYGSVITVKYGHPKGILLITLKRAHGEAEGSSLRPANIFRTSRCGVTYPRIGAGWRSPAPLWTRL